MKTITGGHAIVESCISEGVDTIFGYPGGAVIPLYDALYDYQRKIRHVLTRHEQGAAHAAEGYARASGRIGVCIATSGPGATNLVTGIADALADSVPMVCITGQVPSALLGTQAFQEVPVIDIVRPITKWCTQVTKAEDIPEAMARAFAIAQSGRPGPVLVDITKDAQMGMCDFEYTKHAPEECASAGEMRRKIKQAAKLLNEARRPFVLVGNGIHISNAHEELRAFAEMGGFPVAATLHGLSAIPNEHPLFMGMLGMHGSYAANKMTNEADVILAIGMRFDDRVTGKVARYAPNAKIIHIDISAEQINKIIKVELGICADAKTALQELLPHIMHGDHSNWINRFAQHHDEEHRTIRKNEMYPSAGTVTMAEMVHLVSEYTKGKAIVVSDVGQHQMIAARYYNHTSPRSFISSGGLGTMGFSLPASIGAKIGAPQREVVLIAGDGSFQMTIQELGTIAQEELPIKMIVLDNGHLGMVRQWQELFHHKRYSQVEIANPDFVTVAQGYGIRGEAVSERHDLSDAIERLFAAKGPALLTVKVRQHTNVFPMIPAGAAVDEVMLS